MRKDKHIIFSTFILLQAFPLMLHAQSPGGVSGEEAWRTDSKAVSIPPSQGLTYIGVSRVNGNDEQAIWSIGKGNGVTRIQTTARAADLGTGTFLNYSNDTLPELRLYSYTSSTSLTGSQTFRPGQNTDGRLPVSGLDGKTVEYAVYGRRLSDVERRQVESAMALKYGITLKGSYLNSKGEVIWNGYANRQYSHHIAGVIADSASALRKLSSTSSEGGAFLTLKADSRLSDGESVLIGDDNGHLSFASSKAYGKWLSRRWTTSGTNLDGESALDIAFDAKAVRQINPLADGESYYLAVDPTGSLELKTIRYYKATVSGDTVSFNGIHPGGKDIVAIRAARDMFTTIDVRQPEEEGSRTGSLGVRITGGMPPYRMSLSKEKASVYDRTAPDTLLSVDGLSEGLYHLGVTDRTGNSSSNDFQISMTGITEIPSDGDGGNTGNIKIIAGPNPSIDGYVDVQAELPDAAPLAMTLYTSGGALVGRMTEPADTYFSARVFLPSSGVYLLELKAGNKEKSIKLIRK